jgi:hypothetical protein
LLYRGKPYTQSIADDLFDTFTDFMASPDRPLYFHTDDASLRRMMTYLGPIATSSTGKLPAKPTIMPWKVRWAVLCVGL